MIENVCYGLRQFRRSPGFFAVAALLVAIGIGATTQIFTLIDALLLRPLPVHDPQNLVQLFEQQPKRPADPLFTHLLYRRVAEYSSTLFDVAGQMDTTHALEHRGHIERVHAIAVTENFFQDLGVTPLFGRVIGRGDSHVAVLSYACWARSFGRDPTILGKAVNIEGHAFTVIGIASQAFTGTMVDTSPDLWIPFADQLEFSRKPNPNLDNYVIEVIARLRPGITVTQAQQESAALWERYLQEAGFNDPGYRGLKRGRLEVRSIAHGVSPIRDQSRTALLLLLAGTGLMLLIVCANVGGLLLSRATARERETAVRIALGASRMRILSQLVVEILLLVLIGGSAGFLIAYAGMPVLMHWMPPAHGMGFDPGEIRALALHFSLDFRVAAFSFAVCLSTALLCTLAPAWRLSRSDVHMALKGTISDLQNSRFQSILCGFQVTLCTTLVLSAGLAIRTLENLRASNTGFDRDHIVEFSVDSRVRGYDELKTWFLQQRLLAGVRNLPGVEGAALAYRGLMRGIGLGISAVFPGQSGGGIINTSTNLVTSEYFDVMGIHFLMGRNFSPSDGLGQNKMNRAIVNEAFIRKFLSGREPIGAKFGAGQRFVEPEYEIIGVVTDTKYRSLREVPPPIVYTDNFGPKAYWDTFILHVRTHGDPHAIIAPVRKILKSIDPDVPVYQVATLSEEIDRSLWQERLLVALSSCFGIFALSLSAIGLYGLLAYFVVRREKEIGVRMALGANVHHVVWLVSYRMLPILAAGIAAGAALSWFLSTWARSVLYGVQPFDAVTYVAAIFLLMAIGIGGAAVPVFRAVRVDPATILRWE